MRKTMSILSVQLCSFSPVYSPLSSPSCPSPSNPPLCHSTSPQWAQSASLARPAPCCAPALDKLLPGPWVEAFVSSRGGVIVCVCVCVYVFVYVCIAFTAEGEKGVLSVPKGLPPNAPSPCALLRPKGA